MNGDRLRFWLGEIDGHASEASEYAQMASTATKSACKELGTVPGVIALARKLRKMDEVRRVSHVHATIQLFDALGLFDQRDAFNDTVELMKEIVERAPAKPEATPDNLGDFDANNGADNLVNLKQPRQRRKATEPA